MTPCPACIDDRLRALADALATDDLDRALALGLLEARHEQHGDLCAECQSHVLVVIAARDERLRALAARERYRARQARLAERAQARARRRSAAAPQDAISTAPSLPPAAAAALARAKSRVAAKPQPE